MKVKLIKTEDFYSTMKEWCEGHEFPVISPSMLPQGTFVCENNEGQETYSVCLYNTDSGIAWLGWELSNPSLSKEEKEGCFEFLFEVVEDYAKKVGYQVLFTTSNTPPVERVLESKGFKIGDTDVNHYLKIL